MPCACALWWHFGGEGSISDLDPDLLFLIMFLFDGSPFGPLGPLQGCGI